MVGKVTPGGAESMVDSDGGARPGGAVPGAPEVPGAPGTPGALNDPMPGGGGKELYPV